MKLKPIELKLLIQHYENRINDTKIQIINCSTSQLRDVYKQELISLQNRLTDIAEEYELLY